MYPDPAPPATDRPLFTLPMTDCQCMMFIHHIPSFKTTRMNCEINENNRPFLLFLLIAAYTRATTRKKKVRRNPAPLPIPILPVNNKETNLQTNKSAIFSSVGCEKKQSLHGRHWQPHRRRPGRCAVRTFPGRPCSSDPPPMWVLGSGSPGNSPAYVLSLYKCTRACIPFSHTHSPVAHRSPTKFIPHSTSIDYRPSLTDSSRVIYLPKTAPHPQSSSLPHHSRLAAPRFPALCHNTLLLKFRKEAYNAAGCRWMMIIIVLKFPPSPLTHHRCRCPNSPKSRNAPELTNVERPHRAREITTTKSTSLPHTRYS